MYRQRIKSIAIHGKSATFDAIRHEISLASRGLFGIPFVVEQNGNEASVVIGTPKSSSLISGLRWAMALKKLGPEGFRIRMVRYADRSMIFVAVSTDKGALYGAFHLLTLLQTEQSIDNLQIDQRPRLKLRILNHWDNLDGSIERGYAGHSLWNWNALPGTSIPISDYARANASIGINGSVLNNVNANARILTTEYLHKVAALRKFFVLMVFASTFQLDFQPRWNWAA